MFLTTNPGQPEDTTRKLSEEYTVRFEPLDGGQQMHSIVIIDRGGRIAAKFHGMRLDPLNMVLYINGLTNNVWKPAESEPGWWDSLKQCSGEHRPNGKPCGDATVHRQRPEKASSLAAEPEGGQNWVKSSVRRISLSWSPRLGVLMASTAKPPEQSTHG
jgi:hypothetical protein